MARVFLDANVFIDIAEERKNVTLGQFGHHKLFISPLSIHILTYMYKYKLPDKKLLNLRKYYTIVPLYTSIVNKALEGSTKDFEDNVQLHSASYAECDLFLTNDKKLLDLKFFGTMKIAASVTMQS